MTNDSSTPSVKPLFDGSKPDRRHWLLAISAGMASYLDAAIIVSLGVGLVLIEEHFGLSKWEVGALSSCLTFAIAFGALFGGRIADRLGRMRVFTAYILIYAVGMALMALAPSEPLLFAGVIIAGAAAGADLPTSVAVVSERAPARAQGRLVTVTQVMWASGIPITQGLAFLLADAGMTGIRIIFGQLAVLAVITWAFRRFHPWLRSLEDDVAQARAASTTPATVAAEPAPMRLRAVLAKRVFLVPTLLTMLFYIFWGLVANTFGQFQTYFLVNAGGASQSFATGFGALLTLLGLAVMIIFVRLVDTRWRNLVFVIGGLLQAVSMMIAGVGNGVLLIYVLAIAVFNVGSNLSGEANYKVWTQESLPINVRASVQGFTYAVGRFVFGLFALVTPTLLATNRDGLLWLLVAFSLAALVVGVVTFRFLNARGLRPGRAHEEPAAVVGTD
ncbi:MFS transporter [Ruania zhangjianzhongii]|uniref:MFS transporter n=1 Tax=Ruania zhangjianzhongii TaxID=2603206 RepID=UPI0011CCD18B|nr:MFS transporter [Ruania zhangjianzhongii]